MGGMFCDDVLEEAIPPVEGKGPEAFNKLPKLVDCGLEGGPMSVFFSS